MVLWAGQAGPGAAPAGSGPRLGPRLRAAAGEAERCKAHGFFTFLTEEELEADSRRLRCRGRAEARCRVSGTRRSPAEEGWGWAQGGGISAASHECLETRDRLRHRPGPSALSWACRGRSGALGWGQMAVSCPALPAASFPEEQVPGGWETEGST